MTDRVMTASGVAQIQQVIAEWKAKADRRRRDSDQLISVGEHERARVIDARSHEGLLCAERLESLLAALLAVDAPPPQAEEPER